MPTLEDVQHELGAIQRQLAVMGHVADDSNEHVVKISEYISSLDKTELDRFLANSTFLMTAFQGAGEGAFLAYKAFDARPPRHLEGSAEILKMVGSAAQLFSFAGKIGGAVGVILGEILSFVASFLVGLAPEEKSVRDQLRKELQEFAGEDAVNTLKGVLNSLELQEADLKKMTANSKSWDAILDNHKFIEGSELIWMGHATAWLRKAENQKAKVWPYVFEGYFLAAQQYLENFILALNALKKTGGPSDDVARADSVLKTICDQYDTFINEVGPIALNKGTVWHIGTTPSVYSREWAVSDVGWKFLGGASTRLSVGADERVWTVGNGNHVWTGYGEVANWKRTSIKAEDICVVRPDSPAKASVSDVYTIEDGKLCWRTWDESIPEDVQKPAPARWEKFIPTSVEDRSGGKYSVAAPFDKFDSLVAAGNGIVYLLLKNREGPYNPLYIWDKSIATAHFPPLRPVNGPGDALHAHKGMAISKENIYLLTEGHQIYFSAHKDVQANKYDWQKIEGPVSNSSFVMPKSWSYDQLLHSDDGSLLATIAKKIYLWDGQTWRKNAEGDAVRICKLPVRGWQIYVVTKTLVDEVRKIKPATPMIAAPA